MNRKNQNKHQNQNQHPSSTIDQMIESELDNVYRQEVKQKIPQLLANIPNEYFWHTEWPLKELIEDLVGFETRNTSTSLLIMGQILVTAQCLMDCYPQLAREIKKINGGKRTRNIGPKKLAVMLRDLALHQRKQGN